MPTQDTAQPEQDDRLAKLDWYGRIFTVAVVLLAMVSLIAVYAVSTRHPETDDAEIFANYIGIAPVVAGPILHLNVADNQRVKRGDLLFEIDDRPYKYALDSAVSSRPPWKARSTTKRDAFGPKCMLLPLPGRQPAAPAPTWIERRLRSARRRPM